MKLTDEQIREILAIEAKATSGPWFEQYEYDGTRTVCQMRSTDTLMCINRAVHVVGEPYEKTKENAALIALARNHIRELCEEVLRLRGENKRIRKSATELLDAMETCHVCNSTMSMDDIEPTHCEDCASDCDDHELPSCTPVYVLHGNLRRDLRNAD